MGRPAKRIGRRHKDYEKKKQSQRKLPPSHPKKQSRKTVEGVNSCIWSSLLMLMGYINFTVSVFVEMTKHLATPTEWC